MRALKQQGFSMVELMVSVTIGLILLAGVISIFLSSKMTYNTNEKTARLQENGRVALDFLTHDLRSAGYLGCSKVPDWFVSTLNDQTTFLWNYFTPFQGYEASGTGTWSPALPTGADALNPAPLATSDVIVVRGLLRDGLAMELTTAVPGTTGDPTVLIDTPTAAGQILVITDCESATVFQATGWTPGATTGTIAHATGGSFVPGNASADLVAAFDETSRVVPLQTYVYYVANDASGQPGLYRQSGATRPAELLIEGVQALQLAYAVDTVDADRVADVYVSASGVTNWDNVISVTLGMLMQSADQAGGTQPGTKTYQVLPAAIGGLAITTGNDRRQRMVFSNTVAIRNRAL
jgi:type IV pilus assembly protein PilW